MTAQQYAPAVMQAGVDLGISPKGIVIGFATVFVESAWVMYANSKVPASTAPGMKYDAVGSDGNSVGLFQQQVVGPPWWWGDAATCMDPYKSAALFFSRLAKLDYNSSAQSPGSYAQAIQQSAFPDRYDQRMADAQALYDSLTSGGATTVTTAGSTTKSPAGTQPFIETDMTQNNDNDEDRGGKTPSLLILHTEEGAMTGAAFEQWMADNDVSYGYIINTDGSVIDMETDDVGSWSVLDPANMISINICFAGSYAAWTRDQWLANRSAIESAGYLLVRECLKWGIPIQILVGADYPKIKTQGGITDHNAITVTQLSPGSTHTDVGPNFPWDVLQTYLTQYTPPVGVATPPPATTPPAPVAPSKPTEAAAVEDSLEQLVGPFDAAQGFIGWAQLAGQPQALAELQTKVDAGVGLSLVDCVAAWRWAIAPTPESVAAQQGYGKPATQGVK